MKTNEELIEKLIKDIKDKEEIIASLINDKNIKKEYIKKINDIKQENKNTCDILYINVQKLISKTTCDFYKKYKYLIYNLATIDYDDLTQISNLCFVKCVKKFNPNKGVKFSTYLTNAIQLNLYSNFYSNKKISNSKQLMLNQTELFDEFTPDKEMNIENRILIEQLMECLSDREKNVIYDIFFNNLTTKELSNKYGLGNSSILHIKYISLQKMKEEMEK